VECDSLEWHHHIWVAVLIAFLLDITINRWNDHKGGDLMDLVGEDEEQPLGDEKEMMLGEDFPVTQEDSSAVIDKAL